MSAPRPRFRPALEGLRGIAILAVVAGHVGLPGAAGGFVGVDVFFVLSGFLITGLLVDELDHTGRIDLVAFWARRARRLLPTATLVLLATLAAAAVTVPSARHAAVARDAAAAALFVANVAFARDAVDYFHADGPPSPLLHTWSLAVEEQVYLAWPVLLLGAAALARRAGVAPRRALTGLATAVASASLLVAVARPGPAAFHATSARAWELAVGALLAVTGATGPTAGLGALAVLAAVVGADTAIDAGLAWPGAPTLVPVLGAAAIVAGTTRPSAVGTLLASRPLRAVGRWSYAWYLWHWPLLVLAPFRDGTSPAGRAAAVALGSLGLAAATHRWIEAPLRTGPLLRPPRRALAAGLLLTLATLLAAGALWRTDTVLREARLQAEGALRYRPLAADAPADISPVYRSGCWLGEPDTESPACVFGDPSGARRVVLAGDSHAGHLVDGLDAAARARGLRLDVRIKAWCPLADVVPWGPHADAPYATCVTWRDRVLAELVATPPDAIVLVAATQDVPEVAGPDGHVRDGVAARRAWIDGLTVTLRRLVATGATVIVVRDVPRALTPVPDCVLEHPLDPSACDLPRAEALHEPAMEAVAAAAVPGVRYVDLTDALCDATTCHVVVDGVLVYADAHHLTSTFSTALAERLGRDVLGALDGG